MIENEYHIHEYKTGKRREKLDIGDHYNPFVELFRQKHAIKDAYARILVDDYLNGGLLGLVIAEDRSHNSVAYGFIRRPDDEDSDIVEFGEAFVSDSERRRGIYKLLLQARTEIAIELDIKSLVIYVSDEENPLGNYLSTVGFKKRGTMDCFDRYVKKIK